MSALKRIEEELIRLKIIKNVLQGELYHISCHKYSNNDGITINMISCDEYPPEKMWSSMVELRIFIGSYVENSHMELILNRDQTLTELDDIVKFLKQFDSYIVKGV